MGPRQGIAEPVVQDQELGAGEGVEEFGIGAVGVGEVDVVQQPGGAVVADRKVVTTSRVGQRASQEGFPDAGRAEDENVEVLVDPLALGQMEHETAIEAA